jgi:CPA1 family monovalent cation:H+ antiporter
MVPLILFGMFMTVLIPKRSIDLLTNFEFDESKEFALILAEIALVMVLYREGMHLDLRSLAKNFLPVIILAVVGTVITASVVALVVNLLPVEINGVPLEISFLGSFLIAAIIVPTDPAATISILNSSGTRVRKKIETMLTGESAFNDVIAILLVIILLLPQVIEGETEKLVISDDVFDVVRRQVLGGIAFGFVVAVVVLLFMTRMNSEDEYAYISISGLFAIFIIAPELEVSSAISALIAGIFIKNPKFILFKKKYDEKSMFSFWDNVVFIIEILAFVFIGFLFSAGEFTPYWKLGIALSIVVIAARIFSVFISTWPLEIIRPTREILSNKERLFVSIAGFRGLTTVVLALFAYIDLIAEPTAGLTGLANVILYSSLFLVLFSGVLQGLFLPLISRKTEVIDVNNNSTSKQESIR